MALLFQEILDGTATHEDDRHYIAHANSLRRDLQALSLTEPEPERRQTIEDFLEGSNLAV